MLIINPLKLTKPVEWDLPPSKSHMIRWLVAASQNEQETIIKFNGEPGKDIMSMKRCVENFGVVVRELENMWKIKGILQSKKNNMTLKNFSRYLNTKVHGKPVGRILPK